MTEIGYVFNEFTRTARLGGSLSRTDAPRSSSRSSRNRLGAFNIAEFGTVLIVLIYVIFPLINLVGLGCGLACTVLSSYQGARRASVAYKLNEAIQGMVYETNSISLGGFGVFAKMNPVGGVANSGSNLYFKVTNIYSGQTTVVGPNDGLPPPVDTAANVYECESRVAFDVGPLVDMSRIPLMSSIPGLGKPARLNFSSARVVEHPQGLVRPKGAPQLDGGVSPVTLGVRLPDPADSTGTPDEDALDSGWNYPGIYELINRAGQVVVAEDVLVVDAKNSGWTESAIDVFPGAKLWIDYRADGTWSDGSGGYFSADGGTILNPATGFMDGAMIGRVGTDAPFLMGAKLWNYGIAGSGPLSLQMNDRGTVGPGYADNDGYMTVRVILAR